MKHPPSATSLCLLIAWLLVISVGCALRTGGSRLASVPGASPTGGTPIPRSSPPESARSLLPNPSAEMSVTPAATAGAYPGSVASPAPTPRPALVFLDPGHGGVDTGTTGVTEDGNFVNEKDVALAIALRTADHLRHDGIGVALSRTNDTLPGSTSADYTSDGTELTPDGVLADLQRRIDRANASNARVLLSIHLNAFDDPSIRGTETFYDSSRPFAAQSRRFAELVQTNLMVRFRARGFDAPDRGVTDDLDLVTDRLGTLGVAYHSLVMLGPRVHGVLRPSGMPGALSESLFLSNPGEATAAAQPDVQELIATAYTRAIEQFLGDPAASSH